MHDLSILCNVCRGRKFVFGAKYTGFLAGCVALVLPLTQNIKPLADSWHLLFVLSTVSLLTNEKVSHDSEHKSS